MNKATICRLQKADELDEAMVLVQRVFDLFEAPEYSDRGKREFYSYIRPENIFRNIRQGALFVWGYYQASQMLGVIAIRPPCHISLLFVDEQHHRQGIGRALFDAALSYCQVRFVCQECTVHSSPYAQNIYKKLGFTDAGPKTTENGLHYIPMRRPLP
ncbi:MAG: GNAT family N-acetyltransferase [Christensenellaceae bacterium]|jgi:GNAT superfamily N-acetyltransferase